jgi:hypothetical protein
MGLSNAAVFDTLCVVRVCGDGNGLVEAQMNLSSFQISCLCLVGILELLNHSAKGPGGKDDGVWMWQYQR